MAAHVVSQALASHYGQATIEPLRMSNGHWVVRIFDPQLYSTIILSAPDAARIEREVFRLGAKRTAARIRHTRQRVQRRARHHAA